MGLHRQTVRSTRAAAAILVSVAVVGTVTTTQASPAAFRAGDVGFSLSTPAGHSWVYGDSWVNGFFVRNAITLNGVYTGTINGVERGHWVWPGAPFLLPDGRVGMYGAEVEQVRPGMWGFKVLGGVRINYDPRAPRRARVTPMTRPGMIWAAATARDGEGTLVYAVDSRHHPHVGRPQADGSVREVGTLGGMISGQFTVLRDPLDHWWIVGQAPHLSRRVIGYPLSAPDGKVIGRPIRLATLPSPGPARFTYAATIHPELGGMLTWAVNGHGPGTPYGLQRQAAFWPLALQSALGYASWTDPLGGGSGAVTSIPPA